MTNRYLNPGRSLRSAGLLALVAIAGACGPFHRGSSSTAQIVFKNESLDQADVYAAGPDGNPVRIGTVFAGATDTLRVPATVIGQGGNINVSARLLARNIVPRTGMFSLREGERVNIRLPADERTLVVLP